MSDGFGDYTDPPRSTLLPTKVAAFEFAKEYGESPWIIGIYATIALIVFFTGLLRVFREIHGAADQTLV